MTRRTDLLDERYVAEDRPADAGPEWPPIWNLDGVGWWQRTNPPLWHRCRAHTIGIIDLRRVERCACGATRVGRSGWMFRNENRRRRKPTLALIRRVIGKPS